MLLFLIDRHVFEKTLAHVGRVTVANLTSPMLLTYLRFPPHHVFVFTPAAIPGMDRDSTLAVHPPACPSLCSQCNGDFNSSLLLGNSGYLGNE